ncbi:MAG: phytanoyl-CoA dioxygenase family protein [Candidatus Omnitrophica bacterium]|nr:phytanoyl-CoA dioxygenase family protein [Candidatus Omnitrophota bacterium]
MTTTNPFYREKGYALFPDPVVDLAKVEAAVEGMDAVRRGEYDTGQSPVESPWKPGDDPNALCKIEQPQFANKAILDLISSKEIGERVAEATGAERVQVWWVQLLYKPPTPGNLKAATRVGWHQDWNYWQKTWEEGSELLTAWFALSDVREDSGPMKFVEGSHRWGHLEGSDFYSQDLTLADLKLPEENPKEVSAILKPGGMSLHHCLTLHASSQNVSNEPRRSFAIHLRTDKSALRKNREGSLGNFVEDLSVCPVIYG